LSRSGETTEVLRAAELLQKHQLRANIGRHLQSGKAARVAVYRSFKLTWADEKSTVMTRSFTAILLAFQRLGLQIRWRQSVFRGARSITPTAQEWLDRQAKRSRNSRPGKSLPITFSSARRALLAGARGRTKVTECPLVCAGLHSLEFPPRAAFGCRAEDADHFVHFRAAAKKKPAVKELKQLGAQSV